MKKENVNQDLSDQTKHGNEKLEIKYEKSKEEKPKEKDLIKDYLNIFELKESESKIEKSK